MVQEMFMYNVCVVDCIQLLLAHGAPVRVKNIQGWTPLAESISYGSRQTSMICLQVSLICIYLLFIIFNLSELTTMYLFCI